MAHGQFTLASYLAAMVVAAVAPAIGYWITGHIVALGFLIFSPVTGLLLLLAGRGTLWLHQVNGPASRTFQRDLRSMVSDYNMLLRSTGGVDKGALARLRDDLRPYASEVSGRGSPLRVRRFVRARLDPARLDRIHAELRTLRAQ